MKLQEIKYKNRGSAWILASLITFGLFSIFCVSISAGDKWTKKADMLTSRAFLATSAVNGKIYAIGGRTVLGFDSPPVLPVEEYDPVTDMWTKKADASTARQSLSTSAVNGKIYAIGGWSGPGVFHSTIEEYDPATNTWTKKANMPTARSQLSTSVVNGKIYAIGGKIGPEVPFSTVEEYDPAIDKWTKKADMPTARQSHSTSVVNGKIYAIGGTRDEKTALSTVEEYDPATDSWAKKTDMPTARYGLSTSVVDGKIYAIGGAVGIMPATTVLSTVAVYDVATDTWTRKADMPTARAALSTSAVNGKVYAIGGVMTGLVNTSAVEEYDPGFIPEASADAEGKLAVLWGDVKRN